MTENNPLLVGSALADAGALDLIKQQEFIYGMSYRDFLDAQSEACICNECYAQRNNTGNFDTLPSWPIIDRTHEEPMRLYFLTFKPFDSNYDPQFNGMDHVRNKLGTEYETKIISREILAKKIHYNAMVFTTKDLSHLHETHTRRYFIYCEEKPMCSKRDIHYYIMKEAKERYFWTGLDIGVYDKPRKMPWSLSRELRGCFPQGYGPQ